MCSNDFTCWQFLVTHHSIYNVYTPRGLFSWMEWNYMALKHLVQLDAEIQTLNATWKMLATNELSFIKINKKIKIGQLYRAQMRRLVLLAQKESFKLPGEQIVIVDCYIFGVFNPFI